MPLIDTGRAATNATRSAFIVIGRLWHGVHVPLLRSPSVPVVHAAQLMARADRDGRSADFDTLLPHGTFLVELEDTDGDALGPVIAFQPGDAAAIEEIFGICDIWKACSDDAAEERWYHALKRHNRIVLH